MMKIRYRGKVSSGLRCLKDYGYVSLDTFTREQHGNTCEHKAYVSYLNQSFGQTLKPTLVSCILGG